MAGEPTRPPRKQRSDAGTIAFNDRDVFVLTWMGHQYALRLDQLQWLLATYEGKETAMSEGAARNLVTRWTKAGWVRTERIRAYEPFWIWPTRLALRKIGLPYAYRDIGQTSLDDLRHLAVINDIRLHHGDGYDDIQWVSERQLLQGVVREKGHDLLHRPDAEMRWFGVGIIAIEAELSLKKAPDLSENLMELVRGEKYLHLKTEYGAPKARKMSQGAQSQYTEIWYFGPQKVRKQVRRERARLVKRGDLTEEEADRIFVLWYPLAKTDEQEKQEDREDRDALGLEDFDQKECEVEINPGAERKDRE